MRLLKAHIPGGKVVVDEPTELPEGEEVQVLLGEMGEDERTSLEAALEESEADAAAGRVVSEEEFWAGFRADQ